MKRVTDINDRHLNTLSLNGRRILCIMNNVMCDTIFGEYNDVLSCIDATSKRYCIANILDYYISSLHTKVMMIRAFPDTRRKIISEVNYNLTCIAFYHSILLHKDITLGLRYVHDILMVVDKSKLVRNRFESLMRDKGTVRVNIEKLIKRLD